MIPIAGLGFFLANCLIWLLTLGSTANAAAVETTAGVVSGDVDLSATVGAASFSALPAGLTSGVDFETLGGDWAGMDWTETSVFDPFGFGTELSLANLVERGIDATLTAGLSTAVYETDFLESFSGSFEAAAINLAMAVLQNGIGEGVSGGVYTEGNRPPHTLPAA